MMSIARDNTTLIEAHRTYAHAIAAEVLRKMPQEIDRRELEAAAELGLVEAADAYDAARGVQFKTFAYYRIRGAVYDALRKMGWFSKSHYQEMKFQAAANDFMRDQTETAAPGGGDAAGQWDELKNVTGSIAQCYMLSLDTMALEQADAKAIPADERLHRKEQSALLKRAMGKLPEKNRQVMEAYYFQDLNLDQIGASLGLSKSWVCRVHAKSLELLRQAMLQESEPPRGRAHATFGNQLR
jgi:RNA polymerase sigma factor for flagellar operon FliA